MRGLKTAYSGKGFKAKVEQEFCNTNLEEEDPLEPFQQETSEASETH